MIVGFILALLAGLLFNWIAATSSEGYDMLDYMAYHGVNASGLKGISLLIGILGLLVVYFVRSKKVVGVAGFLSGFLLFTGNILWQQTVLSLGEIFTRYQKAGWADFGFGFDVSMLSGLILLVGGAVVLSKQLTSKKSIAAPQSL
ncbi:MAG: hypothetical protein ABSC50_04400 [Candidatus Bathyarchaeia archaeon]